MANKALPGYPNASGDKFTTVFSHQGPKVYPTGGETLTASELGLGGFDWVGFAEYTISGNYQVVVLYDVNNREAVPLVKVAWYTLAGAQVTASTDLSAEYIRGQAIGV